MNDIIREINLEDKLVIVQQYNNFDENTIINYWKEYLSSKDKIDDLILQIYIPFC
jgi:hypothetical protein